MTATRKKPTSEARSVGSVERYEQYLMHYAAAMVSTVGTSPTDPQITNIMTHADLMAREAMRKVRAFIVEKGQQ